MTTVLLLAALLAATPLEQAGEAAGANVQRSEWSDTLAQSRKGVWYSCILVEKDAP